jgi:hypothetical protein
MYCPQCGQQQASSEMRFCSRCGFPLGGVMQLLAQGGVLRSTGGDEARSESLSPRYKGVRQGVILMLLGTVIVPVLAILSDYINFNFLEVLTALAAVIFFAGGLMRILYAALFEEGAGGVRKAPAEYVQPAQPAQFYAGARPSALPPQQQNTPVPNFAPRRLNTAELVRPPSVTENTTRLLDDEKLTRRE